MGNGGAAMALSVVLAASDGIGSCAYIYVIASGLSVACCCVLLESRLQWFHAGGAKTAVVLFLLAGGTTVAMVCAWMLLGPWIVASFSFLYSLISHEVFVENDWNTLLFPNVSLPTF